MRELTQLSIIFLLLLVAPLALNYSPFGDTKILVHPVTQSSIRELTSFAVPSTYMRQSQPSSMITGTESYVANPTNYTASRISTCQYEYENLTPIKIEYPATFWYATLGNFRGGSELELAGINRRYGSVYFFDIMTREVFAVNNDTEGREFNNGIAITTVNLDSDEYDELFYMNYTGHIFLIDNDASTLKMLDIQLSSDVTEIFRLITIDLNSDNYEEIVVYGRTFDEDFVVVIDGSTKDFLFNLKLPYGNIQGVTVGNFDAGSALEIAIAYFNRTIAIYTPSLTLIRKNTLTHIPRGLYTISNSSWHYDALIVFFFINTLNRVEILNATTLMSMDYHVDIEDFLPTIAVTGDFDADSSTEIAVAIKSTEESGIVIFDLDTNNITMYTILFNEPIVSLVSEKITADDTYDLVVSSSEETYVFKGRRGEKARLTFLRRIDEPTFIKKVFIAQYDTELLDIFIHTDDYLYIYRSDSKPPRVYDIKTYPIRPTIEDSFFYISALVIDESEIYDPVLIYNFTLINGTPLYTNVKRFMKPEFHASNVYLAYFSDLLPGVYTFKITVIDSYDNVAVYDNNGSMYSTVVYSKRIFEYRFQVEDIRSVHPLDVGEIDGQPFSEIAVALDDKVIIVWGNNTISVPITYSGARYAQVYLENIDNTPGDDIILYCYNTTISAYQVKVFSGSTFSLILKRSYLHEISKFAFGDVDGDGVNEIALAENINSTTNKLIVIDTLTNTTIVEYYVPVIYCLEIYNVTPDPYMDIAIVIYDQDTLSLNLTVFAGENYLKQLYSYSSLVGGILYEAYLFIDTFIDTSYTQFILAVSTGVNHIFVINASNGAYILHRNIAYLTGLTVVDYNYDGLKEISFLLYDETLLVIDVASGEILLRKETLLPTDPVAVFWSNFDEDSYEDLVYVLPDSVIVYSLVNDRVETITFPFRTIAASAIGDFFELPSNDICLLSRDGLLEKYININMFYRANVSVTISNLTVLQGGSIKVKVDVRNVFNDPVAESDVKAFLIFNDTVLQSSSFTSHENGSYTLALGAVNIPIGNYTLLIVIDDPYYGIYGKNYNISVKGEIEALVSTLRRVVRGERLFINVTLVDQYRYPVIGANVTVTVEGETYYPVDKIRNTYLFQIDTENLTVGNHGVIITASHRFAIRSLQTIVDISVIGIPHIEVMGEGITGPPIIQGESFSIRLLLYDNYDSLVPGGSITAYFFGVPYTFTDLNNGTYIVTIPTQDVPGGEHPLLIEVSHEFLERSFFSVDVEVLGVPGLNIEISPSVVEQQSIMNVTVIAIDSFGYPIVNADVTISFAGKEFVAENVRDNIYVAEINVGNIHHGEYELVVRLDAKYHKVAIVSKSIFIYPKIPKLDLSPESLTLLLGISIGASFIGLLIYYNISSRLVRSFSVDEQGRLVMQFKLLDMLYYISTILLFVTLIAATALYYIHLYELSVAILGLALLEILLVHGIWLYRDSAYTLINEKLPVIRMIIGLWHLILAPIVIFGIFLWGTNIEWFAFYLLQDVINIGGFLLPSIYLTLMGTYVTSIIVLTINIYLNSRSLKNRFNEMRAGGTPEKVINEEKMIQLDKMSSSIRIKFFVFLAILGASIATTATPLLQYYQLGVIVVLPLVLIIVVPYVISRVLRALWLASRVIKKISSASQTQPQ